MNEPVKTRVPVVWLLIIDVLLIALGVGIFYLYLAVVPQVYSVVAAPGRPTHVAAARIIMSSRTPTLTAAANTTVPIPTRSSIPSPGPTRTVAVAAVVSTALPSSTTVPSATATRVPDAALAPSPTVALRPTSAVRVQPTPAPVAAATAVAPDPVTAARSAPVVAPGAELGNGKFADKFTNGEVVRTATSYQSADINVTLTKVQRKGVTFYVQDIYVRYIDNLRTAFARNTYGRAIAAWTPDIAKANNAIGAINGDYYGAGKIGVVIRNGVLYNARPDSEVCVLFADGTMKVYAPNEFNAEQVMAAGAYQAWDFGPGLMTPEGKAIGKFNSGIAGLHPRTAIGYFEPGHYAFVVADGRQPGYSNGMTLAQLAALSEELGAKVAYNLDGGQTSVMTFGGQVTNQPFRGGRPTSDIIFVGE